MSTKLTDPVRLLLAGQRPFAIHRSDVGWRWIRPKQNNEAVGNDRAWSVLRLHVVHLQILFVG